MKLNTQAFTLIELLVVVLIIGILAAVALPQYQLAIDKARAAQLLSIMSSVQKAQEEFYVANGTYTTDWNSLSINLPGTVNDNVLSNTTGWKLTLHNYVQGSSPYSVQATDTRLPYVTLLFAYHFTNWWQDRKMCAAYNNNTRANRLCKAINGKTEPGESSDQKNVYFF